VTGIKLAFGDLGFYALVILASAIYVVGVLKRQEQTSETRLRVLSGVGFVATAAGIFLGGIWPSYYTLVAIVVLPAPSVSAFAAIRPRAVWKREKLRMYLNFCVLASGLIWAYQVHWELRGYR
jgi:hypothetical protein